MRRFWAHISLTIVILISTAPLGVATDDMSAEMGIAYECMKYAGGFDLPIVFIVEDNGVSVDTPTQKVWGESEKKAKIIRYKYERGYPHQGCGIWVTF